MKIKKISWIFLALIQLIFAPLALAASPAGKWKTIDDATNQARAVVQLTIRDGVLNGTIIKVFPQPGDTGKCENCSGAFKDKPVVGLDFVWGLKQTAENEWTGGQIIDPKNGHIYRCKITVSPDGKQLKVRGYIGVSLLGRTQNWYKYGA